MARRVHNQTPERPILTIDQMKSCIGRLQKCISDLMAFDPSTIKKRFNDPQVLGLEAAIDEALSRAFGTGTDAYNRYSRAVSLDNGPVVARFSSPFDRGGEEEAYHAQQTREAIRYLAEGKDVSITLLKQAISTLESEVQEAELHPVAADNNSCNASDCRKVFVVHGRDEELKNAVARFLNKIELQEVILHEKPNLGRHILTKFQDEAADVAFAVVLMTPDDLGGLVESELATRARQNVVFELGFFIGKLGPQRVVALVKGEIERPSDFDGIVYIPVDAAGAWKMLLAREFKAASLRFNHLAAFDA